MDDEDILALQFILRKYPNRNLFLIRLNLFLIACMLVMFPLLLMNTNSVLGKPFWLFLMGHILFTFWMQLSAPTNAFKILCDTNDLRWVALLLEIKDAMQGTPVKATLKSLLPRFQSSDAHLLNKRARNRLLGYLKRFQSPLQAAFSDEEYAIAILKCLEQTGGEESLLCVRALASHCRNRRVREAAQDCLLFLEARFQQNGETLLRSSSSEYIGTESLLHPAREQRDNAQELLRANQVKVNSKPGRTDDTMNQRGEHDAIWFHSRH